jgi:DNA polymerase
MIIPKINTVERLVSKWKDCVTCPIGTWAHKKCFVSGSRKPKYLFIGEGPGASEDLLGEPFVGPAGRLLRKALMLAGYLPDEWALTNLVACRPCDGPKEPNRPPLTFEVGHCAERLIDTICVLSPKVLITVGQVSHQNTPRGLGLEMDSVVHPAYLLRQGGYKSRLWPQYVKTLKKIRRTYGKVRP